MGTSLSKFGEKFNSIFTSLITDHLADVKPIPVFPPVGRNGIAMRSMGRSHSGSTGGLDESRPRMAMFQVPEIRSVATCLFLFPRQRVAAAKLGPSIGERQKAGLRSSRKQILQFCSAWLRISILQSAGSAWDYPHRPAFQNVVTPAVIYFLFSKVKL